MKVKGKSLSNLKTSSVKRYISSEHSPTPDDVKHILLSHSGYSQQELPLLLKVWMSFQMFPDSLIYLEYLALYEGNALLHVPGCIPMRIGAILTVEGEMTYLQYKF